jgi:hypothetical protein
MAAQQKRAAPHVQRFVQHNRVAHRISRRTDSGPARSMVHLRPGTHVEPQSRFVVVLLLLVALDDTAQSLWRECVMSAKQKFLSPVSAVVGEHAADRRKDRPITTKHFCKIMGGVHRSTIHRRKKRDPRFPAPIPAQLGADIYWESDVYAYLALPKHDEAILAKK